MILASIFLRVGLGEAFVRFYFEDQDEERRDRIARTATAAVARTTTVAALLALLFAAPLSQLLLEQSDPTLLDCAVVGMWAFTNLEMAYAQLRVDERVRVYVWASGANVAMTVVFTIVLVIFAGEGAQGLLLGNFGASALVVLGLWWVLRRRFSLRAKFVDLRAMLHFGVPTVPADASVYALQVVDRLYIYRAYSHGAAGEYAIALQLATVVFVLVRGFQYAWPPVAYSVQSDGEAARLYSLVTTYFVLATGTVVCGVTLLGRWLVRLLAAPEYFGAHTALPWLALGWTLYGLYQVLIVITGRARVTRLNLPAALAGLAVNIGLLLLLVPASGAGRASPVRASLCAAPTWRCSRSCVCSPAVSSPSSSIGAACFSSRPSWSASPSPGSCCSPPPGLAACCCASSGWDWSRLCSRLRASSRLMSVGRPEASSLRAVAS